MLYRTRIALAFKGDRIEKGTEVELGEEDFKQYDRADFIAVEAVEEEHEEPVIVPVDKMTVAQLKAKAVELGLEATGSKADLVERITLHQEEQA